jgi:hypothetical protein
MQKAPGPSDKAGFIYTFQILGTASGVRPPYYRWRRRADVSTPGVVQLKVGRTNNLPRRMGQWSRQCGSHEQVLRGFWPGTVAPAPGAADPGADADVCIAQGRLRAGAPGPAVAKLERLIHLELADLAAYAPYRRPGWPNAVHPPSPPAAGASPRKPPPRRVRGQCPDCTYCFPRV